MNKGKLTFVKCSYLAAVLTVATPLWAGSITIQSNASNLGAALTTNGEVPNGAETALLTTGNTSGLTFTAVDANTEGSFTSNPAGAPAGTVAVSVPPDCGYYCGQSGFVETTFTLPTGVTSITLSGAGNVDDWGYVFLNGNLISGELDEFDGVAFSTSDLAYFNSGVNTFVVSDYNSGGPSAVDYYADINYSTGVTPEPSGLLLLGTGLAGLVAALRRRGALARAGSAGPTLG